MAQHPRSWLRNTLNVWLGYFLTAVAAIPASALGLFLISKGIRQQAAILVSISLAVLGGFMAEQLIALRSRKQRRLVVSASPDTAYQLSWGRPAVTAAGFIEGLSQAALAISSFEHDPAFNEETARLAAVQSAYTNDYKIIASKMFRLPTTSQQQRRVVIQVKGFKAQQGTGNEPAVRADQLTRAAALSPYFDEATAFAGLR